MSTIVWNTLAFLMHYSPSSSRHPPLLFPPPSSSSSASYVSITCVLQPPSLSVLLRFLILFSVRAHSSFLLHDILPNLMFLSLSPLLGHFCNSSMWITYFGVLCSYVLCFVYCLILLFINSIKLSTRNIPGGKGGRCVRLTTYHHTVPLSRNLGALTS